MSLFIQQKVTILTQKDLLTNPPKMRIQFLQKMQHAAFITSDDSQLHMLCFEIS